MQIDTDISHDLKPQYSIDLNSSQKKKEKISNNDQKQYTNNNNISLIHILKKQIYHHSKSCIVKDIPTICHHHMNIRRLW